MIVYLHIVRCTGYYVIISNRVPPNTVSHCTHVVYLYNTAWLVDWIKLALRRKPVTAGVRPTDASDNNQLPAGLPAGLPADNN